LGGAWGLYEELFNGNSLIAYRLKSLGKYDGRGPYLWTKKLDKRLGSILFVIVALVVLISEASEYGEIKGQHVDLVPEYL